MSESWKEGGCHCGAVVWEALTEDRVTAQACNCSICAKTGYIHVIVSARKFRLLRGEEMLTTYRFNTETAQHHFCKNCGVKSFYVPRSNPDGFSLNLRCMDESQFAQVSIEQFDGKQWEENAGSLAGLSRI